MRPHLLFGTSTVSGLLVLALSACAWMSPAAALSVAESAPVRLADIEVIDRSTGERLPIYGHRGERWVCLLYTSDAADE